MSKKKFERTKGAVEYQHKPDSIEVTKTAKGEYSWKVKIYFDSDAGKSTKAHEKVINRIKAIDGDLRKKFK